VTSSWLVSRQAFPVVGWELRIVDVDDVLRWHSSVHRDVRQGISMNSRMSWTCLGYVVSVAELMKRLSRPTHDPYGRMATDRVARVEDALETVGDRPGSASDARYGAGRMHCSMTAPAPLRHS
jgi:hypothetical protein